MQFGFIVPTGIADEVIDLAVEIERAGWDGFFYWDGIGGQAWDPWAILAAAAVKTERVTLGAMIFPLSRRRPWKVVHEALTVDHLSHGRLVLPVGLGAVDNGAFSRVRPEATDRRERAERLDETLEILERAWTGEPVTFNGKHYGIDAMAFEPKPVQQPRIPVWVVAAWPRPKSMARAARWDGIIPSISADPFRAVTPEEVRDIRNWMAAHREDGTPGEIVLEGVSPGDDPAWIESRWEAPNDVETLRARIRQGPPRLGPSS